MVNYGFMMLSFEDEKRLFITTDASALAYDSNHRYLQHRKLMLFNILRQIVHCSDRCNFYKKGKNCNAEI